MIDLAIRRKNQCFFLKRNEIVDSSYRTQVTAVAMNVNDSLRSVYHACSIVREAARKDPIGQQFYRLALCAIFSSKMRLISATVSGFAIRQCPAVMIV